jgi:hypothetical protein
MFFGQGGKLAPEKGLDRLWVVFGGFLDQMPVIIEMEAGCGGVVLSLAGRCGMNQDRDRQTTESGKLHPGALSLMTGESCSAVIFKKSIRQGFKDAGLDSGRW